jgi:hypothetical protein
MEQAPKSEFYGTGITVKAAREALAEIEKDMMTVKSDAGNEISFSSDVTDIFEQATVVGYPVHGL